jgi:hypothetical protein
MFIQARPTPFIFPGPVHTLPRLSSPSLSQCRLGPTHQRPSASLFGQRRAAAGPGSIGVPSTGRDQAPPLLPSIARATSLGSALRRRRMPPRATSPIYHVVRRR